MIKHTTNVCTETTLAIQLNISEKNFLIIGPRCPWGPIYGSESLSQTDSLTETPFADLTDVTLADEDTNSRLTDNANRAIQGNVASDSIWWENL